ncbi:MAG: hypothetical protein D6713_09425 [Deltaproteobacteria bacterium]|nr:MAG: hypothetical protein D6713_09425 [Deltaproteobacteria bacterium]
MERMEDARNVDVAVVGGGPGGILAGYYLKRNDISYVVFERGLAGNLWRGMRPGMILLSPSVPGADWTSLTLDQPLWKMKGVRKPFPTRDDFLCYLEKFVLDNEIRILERCPVEVVVREEDGFRLVTAEGEYRSRFVIVATGCYGKPRFPEIPGIEGNPVAIHSHDYFHCMSYEGKRVLVVGGGNTAAEITIELAGTSRVTLLTKGELKFFTETKDLSHIRGLSESILRELIQFGIVTHVKDDAIERLEGSRVFFSSGREESFDRVIFATGYGPSLPVIEGGEVEVNEEGLPVITKVGESTSLPGLFFAGSLALFHRRCRFIHGFRSEVEKVVWAIFDRL